MKTSLLSLQRVIIIASIMVASIYQLNAQYFQRQYNLSYVPANYRNEYFESGVCTKVNYTLGDTNNYFISAIGTSFSNSTTFFADTLYQGNRVRFTRNNRTGNPMNNRGYEFRRLTNSRWYNSEAHSIAEVDNTSKNGGYVITGSVTSNIKTGAVVAGGSDALFARLGPTGNVISAASIDHAGGAEIGYCIRRSTAPGVAGTFLICGSTQVSSVRTDVFVARVDTAGTVLWFKTYNMDTTYAGGPPTGYNIAYSLAEAPTDPSIIPSFWGGIHVVGTYQDATSPQRNGFYLRIAPNGDYITSCRYFSPWPGAGVDNVDFRSIKWTNDGNLAVTGFTDGLASGTPPGPHTLLIKLTPIIGGLLGSRIIMARDALGGIIPSWGMDVIERFNTAGTAEYYISGWAQDAGFGSQRNVVFKVDFTGFPTAQYLYSRANFFAANSIDFVRNTLFRPGFCLFSGAQNLASAFISDGYITKSYFNGCRCTNNCSAIQPAYTQLNVPAASTLMDTTISYTVTKLGSRAFNYQTILICNQATIVGGSNAKEGVAKQEFNHGKIYLYPIPVNDHLNINIEVGINKEVKIEVFDLSGKIVLEDYAQIEAGESEIQLNTEELLSGFYILNISGESIQFQNKFVKN